MMNMDGAVIVKESHCGCVIQITDERGGVTRLVRIERLEIDPEWPENLAILSRVQDGRAEFVDTVRLDEIWAGGKMLGLDFHFPEFVYWIPAETFDAVRDVVSLLGRPLH